jgi:hypothetical protein
MGGFASACNRCGCDLIDFSAGYLTTCNRKRVADEGREGIQLYLLLGAIYVLNCLHTGFTIAPFQMDFTTRRHLAPELSILFLFRSYKRIAKVVRKNSINKMASWLNYIK